MSAEDCETPTMPMISPPIVHLVHPIVVLRLG